MFEEGHWSDCPRPRLEEIYIFQHRLRLVLVLLLLTWAGKYQFSIFSSTLLTAADGNKIYIIFHERICFRFYIMQCFVELVLCKWCNWKRQLRELLLKMWQFLFPSIPYICNWGRYVTEECESWKFSTKMIFYFFEIVL